MSNSVLDDELNESMIDEVTTEDLTTEDLTTENLNDVVVADDVDVDEDDESVDDVIADEDVIDEPAETIVAASTNAFADLGLRPELVKALNTLGYEEPTPIQREAIPQLIAGRDMVGQAATGTGKTAAFALPILQNLSGRPGAGPDALVLVPTRELAMQVSEAIEKYGKDLGAKVVPVYGGQIISRQIQALQRGVHVVVATPGRAIDHIKRGTLRLDGVKIVVLDEADEMLDMGFAEDLEEILQATPSERQTLLFSATMPPRIAGIAKRHLNDPVKVKIERATKDTGKAPLVRQTAYIVTRQHKATALGRILDIEMPTAAIVFCRTRTDVDELTETLNRRGYRAESLHGGLGQEQRDRVMGRVRSGTTELLIATDVAARGLDIDTLTHVVNYEVPPAPESYVHRIGRVGRAGREGIAITIAEPREQRLLENIERLTKLKITVEKVPTVADLRKRQMEITTNAVRAAIEADQASKADAAKFGAIVESLSGEFHLAEIAAAAIRLMHEASGSTVDDVDIPEPFAKKPFAGKTDRPSYNGDRPGQSYDKSSKPGGTFKERSAARPVSADTALIYIGIGRKDGVRPGDIVGAIANETDLVGAQIGPVKITEKFTTVGVPESSADSVIEALKRTTVRGQRPKARRFTP
jgi:ATP-dependent RNA helicase DeaD